ncbi:MAG: fibronectin type III domain-containing protein [Nitrospira sp.]|nr:fibronectin type III domain-containing protein [Nitrospira sp.]
MCGLTHLEFRPSLVNKICSIALSLMFLSLIGCGASNEQGPTVSTTATATGATANLAWDPVNDPSVIGYYIYYGKYSPNQSGSCSYEHKQFVPSTQGTVTDLELGSTYYFAVNAYNGIEGDCSNEVSTTT